MIYLEAINHLRNFDLDHVKADAASSQEHRIFRTSREYFTVLTANVTGGRVIAGIDMFTAQEKHIFSLPDSCFGSFESVQNAIAWYCAYALTKQDLFSEEGRIAIEHRVRRALQPTLF